MTNETSNVGIVVGRTRRQGARRGISRVAALVVLGVVAATVMPYGLLVPKVTAQGSIRDAHTDQPIDGAQVTYGQSAGQSTPATVEPDGTFATGRTPLTDTLVIDAAGYQTARVAIWPPRDHAIRLAPRSFLVTARNAATGQVIPDAETRASSARSQQVEPGRFRVEPARIGATVAVAAPGFREATATFGGDQDQIVVDLQPRLVGSAVDSATGKPMAKMSLTVNGETFKTGDDGSFELGGPPAGRVRALAPGYRRAEVEYVPGQPLAIRMQPIAVKALYLTLYGIVDRGLRQNAFDLIEKTEANALVIDVKGDRGKLTYRSAVPLAETIGANDEPTISNVDELIATLRQRNIYTIARIVIFKDDMLARNGHRAGLDVAVKNGPTEEPWIDGEDLA